MVNKVLHKKMKIEKRYARWKRDDFGRISSSPFISGAPVNNEQQLIA